MFISTEKLNEQRNTELNTGSKQPTQSVQICVLFLEIKLLKCLSASRAPGGQDYISVTWLYLSKHEKNLYDFPLHMVSGKWSLLLIHTIMTGLVFKLWMEHLSNSQVAKPQVF